VIPRTRDTARGYGARLRAPALSVQETAAPGMHMRLANRFCERCVADVNPTGGRVTPTGFRCSPHQKAKVDA
jgi:hypothetical protein